MDLSMRIRSMLHPWQVVGKVPRRAENGRDRCRTRIDCPWSDTISPCSVSSYTDSGQHVKPQAQLSFVIPVYNGSPTIGTVVELILDVYRDLDIEIVLVNDGSHDDSERVCRELRRAHPETLTYVHLARNFGEHNAVLAGLSHSTGDYVAILDDDGQGR